MIIIHPQIVKILGFRKIEFLRYLNYSTFLSIPIPLYTKNYWFLNMDGKRSSLQFKNTVLLVKDVQKSKKFYIEALHQEIEMDFGKNIGFKSGLAI